MEGINPNTPTDSVPEKIEQSGGDTPASFDDLDNTTSYENVPSKHDGKEINKKKGESNEKESSKKSSKESSKEKEVEEKDSKEEEEVPSTEDSSKEEKDSKEEPKKAEKQPKIIKTKNGEDEVSLRSDAPIDVIVDGKKETVSIQDLINNFSGKTDWSKKYSEFDKEKKTFTKERDTLEHTWREFFKLSSEDKNPIAAINMLGEVSGQNMVNFWKEFRSNLEPVIEERLKLTPEERRISDLQDEIELRDNIENRKTTQAKTTKERQEYITKINTLREESGLSQEDFVKLHKELKDSGNVTKEQLTPELVINFHKEYSALKTLSELLGGVNPKMQGPELNAAVNDLRKVWLQNNLSIEEIKQVAAEVWGDKSARNLSKKLARSEPTKNYKPQQSNTGEAISFDDV